MTTSTVAGVPVVVAAVDFSTVALLAGPMVLAAYLLGSLPWARWWRARQLRRELDEAGRSGAFAIGRPFPEGRQGEAVAVAIEALVPLAIATVTWHVIEAVAPGGLGGFRETSPIAFLSNQAVTVWQSMALWAGAAALVGHVAPVWSRFEGGGTGVPGAMALSLAYAPSVFGLASLGFVAARLLTGRVRPALYVAMAVAVTAAWLGWVFAWPTAWGNNHGPEMSLWVTVVSAILVAGAERSPYTT